MGERLCMKKNNRKIDYVIESNINNDTSVEKVKEIDGSEPIMEKRTSIKENTFYNIIKTISSIIFPIITFPYISRVLQAENVGKINFGNSIVSFFSLIATLGITVYAVRECSYIRDDKKLLGKTSSQIISLNMCTTIIAYLLLTLCLIFVPNLKKYQLLIAIQSISIIFTTLGADWLNTAMEDFKYITIRTFIFQVISFIAMILFVHRREHYIIYAIISVISSSGANIANIFYRRKYCKIKLTLNIDWRRHFPPVMMLFAMLLSQSILNNMDVTMLGFMKGDVQVGLYSTAMKTINIISQVVSSIAWVMMPQLSYQFKNRNYKEINKLLNNALTFTVAIGLPCVVGINILAPEIIEIIGGQEYLGVVNCLHILSIAMAIGFINGIYGNMVLLPSKREKRFMIACVASALVNMIANYLLIPHFEIEGAAIATVGSCIVILVIVATGIEKEINFGDIRQIILAPIIGCCGIFAIGIIIKSFVTSLWIKTIGVVGCSVILYLAVLIKMKNEFALSMVNPLIKRLIHKRERLSNND